MSRIILICIAAMLLFALPGTAFAHIATVHSSVAAAHGDDCSLGSGHDQGFPDGMQDSEHPCCGLPSCSSTWLTLAPADFAPAAVPGHRFGVTSVAHANPVFDIFAPPG